MFYSEHELGRDYGGRANEMVEHAFLKEPGRCRLRQSRQKRNENGISCTDGMDKSYIRQMRKRESVYLGTE